MPMFLHLPSPLVLGSGSPSRAALLEAAGLVFSVDPAGIDEGSIRDVLERGDGSTPADISEVLARAKAETVSERTPGALVIGADQILALEAQTFEKPETMENARRTLLSLQGKTHQLHTTVALCREGAVHWVHTETAHLSMRALVAGGNRPVSRQVAGDGVLSSVGAYKLGVHWCAAV